MAAYAALVSLMNLIEQLKHHPRPPITLDKEQVETLTEKIAFFQTFLEVYNSHYSKREVEHLRSHIADVAYAAEDVIETRIVNRIRHRSINFDGEGIISLRDLFEEADDLQRPIVDAAYAATISDDENISSTDLYQGLRKVIEEMDFVEKEVEEIKEKLGTQEQLQTISTTRVVASKSTSTKHNTMVGFDDVLNEMLDKLTGQPHSPRQIISISGMGGIGKTTLARNVYINPLTEYHFDIRAWITISQEYNIREILLGVLLSHKNQESQESLSQMSDAKLEEKLYKTLYGRRYLIVMDDMWSHDVWDRVKFFFPNESNGSRIIITTRLSNLASSLTTCRGIEMNFLAYDKSWSLFCKTVFGEEDCPSELEHIGMEISKNCKGLPLSIVVLGGLLAKSKRTLEYWEYIAENLNSLVNLEENERCLKILRMSYDHLPAHLKACFLYMGIFPEDHKILVSELIGMWVAERFLKPISGKSFEEIAEEYLMDLIGRSLILVDERESSGNVKFCNIHDLLRDVCIKEAGKEKFICVANQHSEGLNNHRRIAIHQDTSKKEYLHSLNGGSVTRSLICYSREVLPLTELRLLRVYKWIDTLREKDGGNYRLEDIFGLVNLRYLVVNNSCPNLIFPSFVSLLWNLQTLIVCSSCRAVAPPEIWNMPLLRHIESNNLELPDPPSGHTDRQDDFVLQKLHTLCGIKDLKLGEEVVKRIPNVKKLRVWYHVASNYFPNNLDCLYKLEDCSISFDGRVPPSRSDLMQNLTFPHSLKKLALCQTELYWEDISTKIGSLPLLQVLRLEHHSFKGSEWKTVEGQFCSLIYLLIDGCDDLKCWTTESTHFPCLEYLDLICLLYLDEIPLGIGDIPTLKSIKLNCCSDSAIISAKRISEEQEELGNESLQVRIMLDSWNDEGLESLASHNFQIEKWYE